MYKKTMRKFDNKKSSYIKKLKGRNRYDIYKYNKKKGKGMNIIFWYLNVNEILKIYKNKKRPLKSKSVAATFCGFCINIIFLNYRINEN
jgi:hypothetical protein